MRRVFGRRLEQTGHHRRLAQSNIADVFAKIEFSGSLRAKIAAAHIGAVKIQLQDFFLRQMRFQP